MKRPGWVTLKSRGLFLAIATIGVIILSQHSDAAIFDLEGSAGTLSAPLLTADSTDGTPITLDIPNTLPPSSAGSQSATANGSVESGVIRLSAETAVTSGTPSIGSIVSTISGTWSDTLTFTGPGMVGGFEVVSGTGGTADLIFNLDGRLERIDSGSSDPQASYSAQFVFDPCDATGSCPPGYRATSQDGFWEGSGIDGSLLADGTVSPDQLILTGVPIVFGEAFDVLFMLGITAKYEPGGTADGDFLARALFGSTATWGGVQNVMASTPSGSIALEGSNILLTNSAGQDFSTAFDTVAPVPIPAAVWLFGAALIGLVRLGKPGKAS